MDLTINFYHSVTKKLFPGCSGVNHNGVGGGTRSPSAFLLYLALAAGKFWMVGAD